MKKYHGGCHCGAIQFEVEGDFTEGVSCNCSHCSKKALLLAFVPDRQFQLISGENNVTVYHFNKKHIDHTFCTTCGVQSFARGHDGNGNYMVSINLHCLEDLDPETIAINKYDGRSA